MTKANLPHPYYPQRKTSYRPTKFNKPIPKSPQNILYQPTNLLNTNPKPNPDFIPLTIKCYRCNEPGHRSNECPQRKVINMVEGCEESELHEKSEVDEDGLEIVEGDVWRKSGMHC